MLVDCKKIICLELLFILFSIIISNAQNTGGIKGYIIDYSNKKPIKNVNIVLMPGNYASTTDTNGYYFISNIPLGTYTMNISHISYEKIEYSIQILVNKFIEQNFELKAITKVLSPVIVEGMSYNKEPYVINKLEMKQIEEIPIRDIGDYLRSVPNVAAVRKGGIHLDPVVRGLKFSQLNIQLDHGMKIEGGCPNRMDPTASHIEPEDVQNIEVLKGPFALKYGPSLGGVVNINTYKPVPYDTFQIKVKALRGYESNWNGHREYINIDGGNKKVYFNVSGTRKNYGNYEDGNGNKIFSSFHKYSFKSQLGIEPIKNHFFNLSYGEYHARDVRYPALPMDEREDNTKLMSLDYKGIQLTNWFKEINIKIYQSEVEHIMDNYYRSNSDTTAAVTVVEPVANGGRIEGILSFGKHNITIGSDYENIEKDGTRQKNMIGMMPNSSGSYNIKIERIWANANIRNLGFFGEYNTNYGTYELMGIIRTDINYAKSDDIIVKNPGGANIYYYGSDSASTNYINLSGAVAATKYIKENLSISLAAGRGVRSPDMLERFIILLPVGYDNFDYLGNPLLKPEINNEIDLTLKYQHKKYGAMEFNAFYAYVENFIMGERLPKSVQLPLTQNVLGVKKFINSDPVTLKGFEIAWGSSQYKKLICSLTASYTMANISKILQYVTDSTGAVIKDNELTNDYLPEIPPLEGNVSLSYKLFKEHFRLNANLRIVAEQNKVSKALYEPKTPGYTIANLSLNYKHNKYLTLAAGVNNLFNKAYYEHLNRKIVGSTARLYEPGRVFFLNLIINV